MGTRCCCCCSYYFSWYLMMARIGQEAPDFTATAVVGTEFKEITLSSYRGKYVVLFFYPLDFTFVCPTEILSFSNAAATFREHNCEVIGASIDSQFTHLAWINTPKKEGGLGGALDIPLVADLTKEVSEAYGVMLEGTGHTCRGLFVISDTGVVRHITMNDPPVGRNVDEVLRLVQAYQFADKNGEVCPVNWKPGKATMKPDPVGSKEYFEQQ